MAISTNVIRTLTIKAKAEGVDAATASLNKLGQATVKVSEVSDTQAKRTLSVESAYQKLQRRYDQEYRAQQSLANVQRDLDRARAQGLVTQSRASELMQAAIRHHNGAGQAASSHAAALQAVSAQASMLAGRLGPLGSVLTSMGTVGVVAAGGLGAVAVAIYQAIAAANALADKSGKMVDFAETTGLTTTQLQALQKAAAFVGIEADKVGTGFEKFTIGLEQLSRGSGELFEGLNRINPALSRQLALTENAGDAWDIFARAVAGASREQANALSKAAFGRQGVGFTRLASASVDAGDLAGLEKGLGRVNTLTAEQLKTWDDLKDKIDFTSSTARNNLSSIFTTQVLQAQLAFVDKFLAFSQAAKEFSVSGDLSNLLKNVLHLKGNIFGKEFEFFKPTASAQQGESFADGVAVATNSPLKQAAPNDQRLAEFNLAVMKKQIAAMGEAATSAEKLKAAEMQLAISAKEAGLSQVQYNSALAALRSADALDNMRNMVSALGSAATVTETQALKVAELNQKLQLGAIDFNTYSRAMGGLKMDEAIRAQSDMVSALGDAATPMDQYKLKVMQLQQQLEQGRISQETFNKAVVAANPLFQQMKGLVESSLSGLVKDLAKGTSLMDALASAAGKLGDQLIDIGVKSIVNDLASSIGSDTLGFTTGATTASGIIAPAIISAFTTGASTAAGIVSGSSAASSAGTAASGASGLGGMSSMLGPAMAVAGVALSWWSAAEQKRKAAEEAQAKAWTAWQGAAKDLATYLAKASGTSIGSVQTDVEEMRAEWTRLATLRGEAIGDTNAGNTDAVLIQLRDSFIEFETNTVAAFREAFSEQVDTYFGGFGSDGSYQTAISDIKTLGEELQSFVADTSFAFSDWVAGQNTFTEAFGNSGYVIDQALSQVQQAKSAAISYALSQLDTQEELTDVAKSLQTMAGTAKQLQTVLEDLGLSAAHAAAGIQDRLTAAMAALREATELDVRRQIAEANGTSYIFDVLDAINTAASARSDLALVGGNTGLADTLLSASVQEIIDQNELMGDSYAELLTLYPQLTDQVHAYTEALTSTLRSASELADASKSLSDRMWDATIDTSTLEGALADFERDALAERTAEIKSGGELINELTAVQEAERYNIVKSFAEQSAEALQSSLEDAQSFLDSFSRTIKQFVDGLRSGSDSPLSPQARLTAAQNQYNTQLALAQSGKRDALNGITGYADDLLDASKAFYASSASFQTTFNNVVAQLTALPAQVSAEQLIVNAVDAVKAAVDTMKTTLNTAINSGSASAIAEALSSYFNTLDLNTDNLLTQSELLTVMTSAQVATIMQTLDTDNSGSLSELELIKASTDVTADAALDTVARLDTTIVRLNTTIDTLADSIIRLYDINNSITGSNQWLDAIEGLQATAAEHLRLMKDQLTIANTTVLVSSGPGGGGAPEPYTASTFLLQNNMLAALNKIAFNTYAISYNTALANHYNKIASGSLDFSLGSYTGTYATGGVIPPFGVGLVSEHSSGGGRFIRAGAEPIVVSPYAPHADNDNAAVVSELRQLNRDLSARLARLERSTVGSAQANAHQVVAGQRAAMAPLTRAARLDAARPKARARVA